MIVDMKLSAKEALAVLLDYLKYYTKASVSNPRFEYSEDGKVSSVVVDADLPDESIKIVDK